MHVSGFWATLGEEALATTSGRLFMVGLFFFPAVKRCGRPAPEDEQRMDIGQHSGSAFALLILEKQEDCVKSTGKELI